MDFNLNYLRFFIEAAESKSLSEVSKKIGYEVSNISSTISKLEQQLGVTLFTRNPLELTEIGRDIYKSIIKGYREIEFASVIAKSKNNIDCGEISIGCPVNITKIFFMKKITQAINEHPNLKITIDNETDYKKIINKINNNLLQFALLDFIPTDDDIKSFEIRKIFDTKYIFVSNKKEIIENKDDLNNFKYITSEDFKYSTSDLKKHFEKHNLKLNRSVFCSDTPTKISAAKNGLGLAYVLEDSVKEELERKELFKVKIPIELPKTSINLIYLKDRLTRVDKEFIKNYLNIVA